MSRCKVVFCGTAKIPFDELQRILAHAQASLTLATTGVILHAARDVAAVLKGETAASVVNPEALRR